MPANRKRTISAPPARSFEDFDIGKKISVPVMAWLISRRASETEMAVYLIVSNLYKKHGTPIQNGDVQKIKKGHRTGIRFHLLALIEKKIIKKHGERSYVPLGPEFMIEKEVIPLAKPKPAPDKKKPDAKGGKKPVKK